MKNIIKISAAGSGKTYNICHDALGVVTDKNKKVLIVTYTNRGKNAVENEVRNQNKGVLHQHIIIKTWYQFLLSDAIKPYQRYITGGESYNVIRGLYYPQNRIINYNSKGTIDRYITTSGNIISNYASELACILNEKSNGKIIGRLADIYSNIYFDEVQDLAGYDIDLLKLLLDSHISITCCGDNKQATFSTHNTKKNKNQTGKNIWSFFARLKNVEIEKNLISRRFNHDICSFANRIFPFGEQITTIMNKETEHDGVFLINKSDVDTYYQNYRPQVLRYNVKTKVEKYHVVNFGACKGETFDRVLIFPNNQLANFVLKGLPLNSPEKYYVGVTRPRYSIAIAIEDLPKELDGYEEVTIICKNTEIRGLKYIIRDA